MTRDTLEQALAEVPNSLVTPLYFDRQVIRAADLTLDRSSHDEELARMRRLLHGWGVVVGLVPVIEGEGSRAGLSVSRGYAVTPTGEEVFLTAGVSVPDIAAEVVARCGSGARPCELVDPNRPAAAEGDPLTAWLVARPVEQSAQLQGTIPEGCDHPANGMYPSRRCGGVRLDVLCSLPATHTEATPPSVQLAATVCGPGSPDAEPVLLPMPQLPGPEASFVVLGRLLVRDGGATFTTEDRRTLLPLQTLQAWVSAKTCPGLYYVNVNARDGGEHLVHVLGCPTPAREEHRIYLGAFTTCEQALEAARARVGTVDGCANCVPDCHTL
jgi:hypothetical protein